MRGKKEAGACCAAQRILFFFAPFSSDAAEGYLLPLQSLCFINSLQFCWNRNQLPEDILRVNGPKFPSRNLLPITEQLLRPRCRAAALTQDEAVVGCERRQQQLHGRVSTGRRHCRSCISL